MRKIFQEKATGYTDKQLFDQVQRQTLKYFWDFAHPVSGMARERSNPVPFYDCMETVTSGGTGFGIMALLAGAERRWHTKKDVSARIHKIVDFLSTCPTYHGAFPHFLNGTTGETIPFSDKDDGGDLVETAFLMAGLLSARQYFPRDKGLTKKIDKLWHAVEWDFYTRGQDTLYWHWSPKHDGAMNLTIHGWNECLIAYVLAAASPTHAISPAAYHKGWTAGRDFKNTDTDSDTKIPLGTKKGGPLFFAHYSFLGLDPRGLKDQYADYGQQNYLHTLANYRHCVENPHGHKGYGPNCWGLTASDDKNFYDAHSPTNDNGTITPTAALSSFPYMPAEAMQAMRHFHEKTEGNLWGPYGFMDAFNEGHNWQAPGYLAIDQGPIVVMMENYRSGLLWNLFMSCPEIKQGLRKLSFESPHLQATPSPATQVTHTVD